jgi:hypothetical protein
MEEKVVQATGVSYQLSREHLLALIRQVGLLPVQRTTLYETVREHREDEGTGDNEPGAGIRNEQSVIRGQ